MQLNNLELRNVIHKINDFQKLITLKNIYLLIQ